MNTEQYKNQLDIILNKLDHQDSNKQKLGFEALEIIKEVLKVNPFDVDMLTLRIRLNANILENTSQIIEDAVFISENKEFEKDRVIGFDWLFWIYDEVLVMPEKAIETLEEQLIEIHSIFNKTHIKDKLSGELLHKLASIKYGNGKQEEALEIWRKSFDTYPILFERNKIISAIFLQKKDFVYAEKILENNLNGFIAGAHYDTIFTDANTLKELISNNEITDKPNLIGIYYNLVRNLTDEFGISGKLDFYEQYLPELEKWGEKFPKCSIIWTAIGNCYFLDLKNYDKALEAYKKMLAGDNPYKVSIIKRVYKVAKKTNENFWEFEFPIEGNGAEMYELLTLFNEFFNKAKKKKQKKKYLKLALQFGKNGYNQYHNYLINGNGEKHNNQPHRFAMLCNNYAIVLGDYADSISDEKEIEKTYNLAGDIHIEGYQMSPFIENIGNASSDYLSAKNYKKSIESTETVFKHFKDELNVEDTQMYFLRMVKCYVGLDDIINAEKYYYKAKELYIKVGQGAKEATYSFIFSSQIFYDYTVTEKKDYKTYISEIEWFLEQEKIQKQEPKEIGLVAYFLGVCYMNNSNKEKAAIAFQKTVDYLQDIEDWEFYETKCMEAEKALNNLGVKVIKKKNDKSISKRIINIIIYLVIILGLFRLFYRLFS